MPDYGHHLTFGTFITPAAAPANAAVALAQLSEDLGFDLVTFQDHPYQPSFLDTWTLLAYVAAKTERIQVSANVINLPLRPPAVLARAAASLDLLSGGRVALGLGAGAFWDAIAAMGGPRRTPGQGVDALSEGIDIIRGIWDGENRTPLRVAGTHYSVDGAKRGPAPAHDIPIWLGAYKPRMLRLTGRKADGWLPSLSYLQEGDLARGNDAIDDSAITAGRDPHVIRRLLSINGRFAAKSNGALDGPPSQWADELTTLALQDGIGTFILASDDPDTLERFSAEVMPAVRAAVDQERNGRVWGDLAHPEAPTRNRIATSHRVAGIDYAVIPASLVASAIEPGHSDYARLSSTYMRGGSPALILQPADVAQVAEALAFARNQSVPLGVRSAGHGISGRSTNNGGIIINLAALKAIEIMDEPTRRIRVEPAAKWSAVAAALAPHGWALTSGDYGGVGVGGLATAGGVGWLAREHGLTIDHLRAVDIILADSTLVHASETENADLFWAVRGAGANFGIVVSFEFEAAAQPNDVAYAQFVQDASDTAAFLTAFGATVEASPRDLTSSVIIQPGRQMSAHVHSVVDSDDKDTILERLQPLADLAPLLQQRVQLMPYSEIMANDRGSGPHSAQGEPQARSGLIDHITPEFAAAAAEAMASGAIYWFQIRSVGGAVGDIDPDATAYGYRAANFSIIAMAGDERALNDAWAKLHPHFNGAYLSFETGLHESRIDDAFPPKTLARLRTLKTRYDPDNVFRDNFNLAIALPL
jgi:alkanesulfonate monooxygenase SsuD/methylene tetrahydromethanopterin reductase-like flavin-dependent oxidoreductase (luciferase family)